MTDMEAYKKCHEQVKTIVTADGKEYTGMMWVTTDICAQEDDDLEEGYVEVGLNLQIPISRIAEIR